MHRMIRHGSGVPHDLPFVSRAQASVSSIRCSTHAPETQSKVTTVRVRSAS